MPLSRLAAFNLIMDSKFAAPLSASTPFVGVAPGADHSRTYCAKHARTNGPLTSTLPYPIQQSEHTVYPATRLLPVHESREAPHGAFQPAPAPPTSPPSHGRVCSSGSPVRRRRGRTFSQCRCSPRAFSRWPVWRPGVGWAVDKASSNVATRARGAATVRALDVRAALVATFPRGFG